VARRTERDLPLSLVVLGSLLLVAIVALLAFIPPRGRSARSHAGHLVVAFGFSLSSRCPGRIVGIIGNFLQSHKRP